MEAAINLAIEYTAFVGNLDKIVKPALDKEGEVTSIVNELELQTKTTSLRPLEYTQNFSRKDLEQTVEEVITKKWEKIENQIGQILEAMKIQQNMDINPRNTSNRESVNLSPRGRSLLGLSTTNHLPVLKETDLLLVIGTMLPRVLEGQIVPQIDKI